MTEPATVLESAVVRFAGDSGDGMQLAGSRFAAGAALAGNDLATYPDYPAEIRAPAGTPAGVSAFQVNFASHAVLTPGDAPDVLVAMNPAALRTNLGELRTGGTLILNTGAFTRKNLDHAGYDADPRDGEALAGYRVIPVDMNALTLEAVGGQGLTQRAALRSRNFFALGLVCWMFHREAAPVVDWIEATQAGEPTVRDANLRAFKTGYHYGETQELAAPGYVVRPAPLAPGRYRQLSGNEALGLGLMTAAERAGLDLVLASYPITPASDILHFLAGKKAHGVRTFQAEDEIAAMSAAIGAAYAGSLAVTTTSGPGMALKAEALGLAVSLELPLVVVDVQRAGPSTGLPTKAEQSDLLLALFGRSGEAPLPVVAARSPGDCFWAALEAARIAVAHMTPVVLLSDASLANGAEPWRIPRVEDIAPIEARFATDPEGFQPFARDARLARPWAVPGTPGLEHRIGGLEKADGSGNVSYDPANHARMCALRAEKVAKVAEALAPVEVHGDSQGDLLVLGWGSTYGAIREAVDQMRGRGHRIGHVQLRHLNPFPPGLARVLAGFDRVLVPELNAGQLAMLLRARFLVDAESCTKLQGRPFKVAEILAAIAARLEDH